MYYPIENGSVYEIPDNAFGFIYKCQLPPVGYGVNVNSGKLQETDIIKRSDIPEEQYWERYVLPHDFKSRRKIEKDRQKFDKFYFDPYLENIRRREWKRRLCGVWFWNFNPQKGESELLYITGTHYFYATYWKFQGKHMDFRINDMECWYIIRYLEENPNALGVNEITKRKLGKCFKINTLIRMYDGSKKMVQDICDGEYVMGDDSKPRLVSGATSGEEEMFEITPNKGEPFTVNRSHILHCIKSVYGGENIGRKEVNITVDEYLKLSESAKKLLLLKRVGWGDWASNQHIVNPYFLGIWLGDGVSKGLQITNEDKEVVEYLKEFSLQHGLKYHNCGQKSNSGNKLQHILSNKERVNLEYNGKLFSSRKELMVSLGKHKKTPLKTLGLYKHGEINIVNRERNHIWDEFKRMNLQYNKHIPKEYLIDSRENRLLLLAGLIDSDGCLVKKDGKCCYFKIAFSNKYKQLQDDIVELIQSLGFYCGVTSYNKVNAKCFTIFGNIEVIPTKIERKRAWANKKTYDSMLCGFTVKSVGVDKYYGFAVDKNHLFLLADGTVVHNTARLGCWLYERTSRRKNKHAGLQSKADDDAEEVMKKAIVQPWQKLPDFFRPIYDTMKGDDPKELRFFHPSRKGATTEEEIEEEALESWIDFGSSGEAVYDGPELDSYGSDESGKTKKPVSIKERQNVTRYCAEIDGEFGGRKQWYTTTVEIEPGEEMNYDFQDMTANSNPLELDANGRTGTGLYTYFLPAQKGMFFDRYGYPDEKRALQFLNNTIAAYEAKGDLRGLSSFKRKNPRNFKEAFSVDGTNSLYNPEILNRRLDEIEWTGKLTERGDLVWKDGFKIKRPTDEFVNGERVFEVNEILWVPNANGRFERVAGWKPKIPNMVTFDGQSYAPNNPYLAIGCDPFRYDKTKDKRRSNCAAYAYQIPEPMFPDRFDDTFVLSYVYRADSTRESNEDMLKMAWYCGSSILFERQVNHWKNDFRDWDCARFYDWLPGEVEPGVSASTTYLQDLCNYTESYINQHIGNVWFKELIRKDTGWLGFKVEDTETFDRPMAAGITLIKVKGQVYRSQNRVLNISDFFASYNN